MLYGDASSGYQNRGSLLLYCHITEILVCSVLEPMSDNVVCFLRKPTVQRLSGDGDEGDPRWISR